MSKYRVKQSTSKQIIDFTELSMYNARLIKDCKKFVMIVIQFDSREQFKHIAKHTKDCRRIVICVLQIELIHSKVKIGM